MMGKHHLLSKTTVSIVHRLGLLQTRLWLPLFCSLLSNALIYGQTTDPSGTRVGTEIRPSDARTQPIPSNMEFISKLLQTDLKKGRESLGKVVDVAFDLETGHLALLVASSGTSDLSKRYALLPFIPGDRLIQFDWEKKLTLQSQPLTAARAEAAELYRDYKQAIYWIDFAKKKMADSKGTFDEKAYALTFYSTLVQRPIVDMDGTPVGKVDDVAIKSANGEILYMVMLSDDSEKRAIPLAAFVGDQGPDSWSIELMAAQIFKFKPFTLKDPPSEVERGWEEYVATRYGRSGLQAKKKVE